MQPFGGAERAGGLGRPFLGLAEHDDGLGEHGQSGNQHNWTERRVATDVPIGGKQSGGSSQAVTGR
jgi:hypothetical protein